MHCIRWFDATYLRLQQLNTVRASARAAGIRIFFFGFDCLVTIEIGPGKVEWGTGWCGLVHGRQRLV
jgi:hypothetical protein